MIRAGRAVTVFLAVVGLSCALILWLSAGDSVWLWMVLLVCGAAFVHRIAMNTRPVKVPVVMLHSIVGFRADRPKSFSVWCAPHQFEAYLQYLRRRSYTTITLQQLHDHLSKGAPLPKRPIILTFDDAYLDNWVYAAPLLRKYGFTGTVFVPTDFIQDGETARPTMDDVLAGRLREEELECFGYLNRAELRRLADEGVMDLQSHGKTHTWLPVSTRVVRFHNPHLPLRDLRWMWWNRNPERKPSWFQEIRHEDIPWGAPVYENKLALSHAAVTPDPALEAKLTAFVQEEGGRAFFDRPDWEETLREIASAQAAEPIRRENDAAFRERLREELVASRETLAAITGKPVRFMCWPNGGTCPVAFELLEECGYLAATVPSRMKQPRNHRGTNPLHIGRISGSSFFRGTRKAWPWALSFALKVERNRGNGYMELPIKAIWLYRRFVKPSGGVPPGAEE